MKRTMRSLSHFGMTALAAMTLALGLSASLPAQRQTLANSPAPEQGAVNTFSDCTVVADNLVANCGFETGAFTPEWTRSGGDSYSDQVATGAAHSGNFGAALSAACISQTLTTVPDQSYDLSYWLEWNYVASFDVRWNGEIIDRPPAFDFQPYTQHVVSGLIGMGADTLTFCARNNDYWFFLDDIVVLPSPASPR